MAGFFVRVFAIVLTILGTVRPTFACSCPDSPEFDALAKKSAIVLEGRVSRVVDKLAGWRSFEPSRPSPVYIDVDVTRILKGTDVPARIRIWDPDYGGSCEGVLVRLGEGTAAAFVLTRVSDERAREGVRLGAPVPAGGYVLPRCGAGWRRLKNKR